MTTFAMQHCVIQGETIHVAPGSVMGAEIAAVMIGDANRSAGVKSQKTYKRKDGGQMARPTKPIDERLIRELAGLGCNVTEIARVANCSRKTLERRFTAAIEAGRTDSRVSLRRRQFQAAMSGSVPMLIWLGKNWLGQTDKSQVTGADGEPLMPPQPPSLTVEFVTAPKQLEEATHDH